MYLLFGEPRIHHVHHSINGQGSLRNVGADHNLPARHTARGAGGRGLAEYLLLGARGETGAERVDDHRAGGPLVQTVAL